MFCFKKTFKKIYLTYNSLYMFKVQFWYILSYVYTHKALSTLLSLWEPSFLLLGDHWSAFCYSFVFILSIFVSVGLCHMYSYLPGFCYLVSSILRFFYVVTFINSWLYLIVEQHSIVWIYYHLFIHLPDQWHLRCFQFLAIYKQNNYEHSCASLCIDLAIHFSEVIHRNGKVKL